MRMGREGDSRKEEAWGKEGKFHSYVFNWACPSHCIHRCHQRTILSGYCVSRRCNRWRETKAHKREGRWTGSIISRVWGADSEVRQVSYNRGRQQGSSESSEGNCTHSHGLLWCQSVWAWPLSCDQPHCFFSFSSCVAWEHLRPNLSESELVIFPENVLLVLDVSI